MEKQSKVTSSDIIKGNKVACENRFKILIKKLVKFSESKQYSFLIYDKSNVV